MGGRRSTTIPKSALSASLISCVKDESVSRAGDYRAASTAASMSSQIEKNSAWPVTSVSSTTS